MPRRDEYNVEFTERPFHFEIEPLNDLTSRGAKVKSIAPAGLTAGIRPNSIVVSINGERVSNFPIASVQKKLDNTSLPIRIRFGIERASVDVPPSVTVDDPDVAESDNDLAPLKKSPSHRSRSSSPRRQFRKFKSEATLRRSNQSLDADEKPTLSPRRAHSRSGDMSPMGFGQQEEVQKSCSLCSREFNIINRRYNCRKCSKTVCGKCSREKRYPGHQGHERFCDECIEDEYKVLVTAMPLRTIFTPSPDGKHIVVRRVSPGGNGANLKIEEGTYLTEIDREDIQGQSYDVVLVKLEETRIPFELRFKRPNVVVSDMKEKEDDEEKEAKPKQKTKKSRTASPSLDGTSTSASPNVTPSSSNTANLNVNVPSRNTQKKRSHRRAPSQRLIPTVVKSPIAEEETDIPSLEDNPGMEFIRQAEEHYENENWWDSQECFEKGIKLLESSLEEIDNLNKKRERKQQISEYRLQMMRAQRKAASAKRARKWAARQENAERGGSHRRTQTLQPSSNNNSSSRNDRGHKRSSTNDGNGGGNDAPKDPDDAFRRRLESDIVTEAPDVSFKDVLGLESVKLALYESIILPALRPEIFTGLRAPATGLLLFGPPGNGKTMIAKCVASECQATFFSVSASSITSKWVGEAERIMRTLFTMARERSPSIIFIDEIDSLLTARGGKGEAESSRRIKTEFLVQFDGVHSATDAEAQILVIGATNLPHQLDDAVLRRFSKRIQVPIPDESTRYGIIRMLLSKQHAAMSEQDVQLVVKATKGYSCSDINLLCRDSAMGPVRDMGSRIDQVAAGDLPPITHRHFLTSLRNVRSSIPPSSLKAYREWDEQFGSKMTLSVSALPESMRPKPMPSL